MDETNICVCRLQKVNRLFEPFLQAFSKTNKWWKRPACLKPIDLNYESWNIWYFTSLTEFFLNFHQSSVRRLDCHGNKITTQYYWGKMQLYLPWNYHKIYRYSIFYPNHNHWTRTFNIINLLTILCFFRVLFPAEIPQYSFVVLIRLNLFFSYHLVPTNLNYFSVSTKLFSYSYWHSYAFNVEYYKHHKMSVVAINYMLNTVQFVYIFLLRIHVAAYYILCLVYIFLMHSDIWIWDAGCNMVVPWDSTSKKLACFKLFNADLIRPIKT